MWCLGGVGSSCGDFTFVCVGDAMTPLLSQAHGGYAVRCVGTNLKFSVESNQGQCVHDV